MNEPECTKTPRTDNHVLMDEAIESINDLITNLNRLHDRINGTSDPVARLEDREQPTLLSVLSRGPDRVRQSVGEAHEAIQRIESGLF